MGWARVHPHKGAVMYKLLCSIIVIFVILMLVNLSLENTWALVQAKGQIENRYLTFQKLIGD